MSDGRENKNLEEKLADYTDRLLENKVEPVDAVSPAGELEHLQETARQIREAFPGQSLETAMQNRIRTKLVREWHQNGPIPQSSRRTSRQAQLRWTLGLAAAALVVIVLIGSFLPTGGAGTAGTAGNHIGIWLPLTIIAIAAAGFIYWKFRKK